MKVNIFQIIDNEIEFFKLMIVKLDRICETIDNGVDCFSKISDNGIIFPNY